MIGIYATHVQCRKSILGIWFLKLIFQSPNFVILTTLPKVWDILQLEYYEFFLKICTLSAKQGHYSTYSLIWSGCVLPCHSSPTTKWATYSENLILSFILEFLHTEKCTYLLYMMVFYIILRTFRVKKVYVDSMSLSCTIGDFWRMERGERFLEAVYFPDDFSSILWTWMIQILLILTKIKSGPYRFPAPCNMYY